MELKVLNNIVWFSSNNLLSDWKEWHNKITHHSIKVQITLIFLIVDPQRTN